MAVENHESFLRKSDRSEDTKQNNPNGIHYGTCWGFFVLSCVLISTLVPEELSDICNIFVHLLTLSFNIE